MALQASGAISLSQVNMELGLAAGAFISLGASNVRTLAGVASGLIALSNLYGKSKGETGKGYINIPKTSIFRIDFSNDSFGNIASTFSDSNYWNASVNSAIKGYFAGGSTAFLYGSNSDKIFSIVFNTESTTILTSVLTVVRYGAAGVNSTTKGYFGGGYDNSSYSVEIDGIIFSNEATINPSATLITPRCQFAGVNSNTRGYFAGGLFYGGFSSEIDGITFATEAAINPSAALISAREEFSGLNSDTKGYFAGGYNGSGLNSVNALNFSSETTYNLSATLTIDQVNFGAVNSLKNGYFTNGHNGNFSSGSPIHKLDFTTETVIPLSNSLVAGMVSGGVQSGAL